MNSHRPSILIVDDDEVFRTRLGRAFEARGYDTRTAGDSADAITAARDESPEFAVVDLRMPGPGGLELVRELKKIDPATKVVILTGYGSIATAIDAIRLGATHYLPKPADADDIVAAFARGDAPPLESAGPRIHRSPIPGPRRVGAHQPRPLRLRRQHLRSRAPPRHPPPIPPAQAPEVPPLQVGDTHRGRRPMKSLWISSGVSNLVCASMCAVFGGSCWRKCAMMSRCWCAADTT